MQLRLSVGKRDYLYASPEHSSSLCVGSTSWCTPSLVRSTICQISGTGELATRGAAPFVGRSCWVVRMGGKAGGGTVRACGGVGCDNVRWRGGGVCEWVARGMLTCKSRVMQRSWQMESTNGWTGRVDSVGGTARHMQSSNQSVNTLICRCAQQAHNCIHDRLASFYCCAAAALRFHADSIEYVFFPVG